MGKRTTDLFDEGMHVSMTLMDDTTRSGFIAAIDAWGVTVLTESQRVETFFPWSSILFLGHWTASR